MKFKIKFELVDIILCVLLAVGLTVNIWAYMPKGTQTQSSGKNPPMESETIGSIDLDNGFLTSLSSEDLDGEWDVNMIMYSDTDMDIPYAIYKLVFDIRYISGDAYSVGVTTVDSEYADSSINPDVPPEGFAPALIEDESFAALEEGGILKFWFSYEADNAFSIIFKREDNGVLTGIAFQTPDSGLPEGELYTYLVMTKR